MLTPPEAVTLPANRGCSSTQAGLSRDLTRNISPSTHSLTLCKADLPQLIPALCLGRALVPGQSSPRALHSRNPAHSHGERLCTEPRQHQCEHTLFSISHSGFGTPLTGTFTHRTLTSAISVQTLPTKPFRPQRGPVQTQDIPAGLLLTWRLSAKLIRKMGLTILDHRTLFTLYILRTPYTARSVRDSCGRKKRLHRSDNGAGNRVSQ